MDEDLRQHERGGPIGGRAWALRRAGREEEARRRLEDAAWSGDPEALESLERWYPLSDDEVALVERLRRGGDRWWVWSALAVADPRVAGAARGLEASEGEDASRWLSEPLEERRLEGVRRYGCGVLARARWLPGEASRWGARLLGEDARLSVVSGVWLLGTRAERPSRLRSLFGDVERAEAWRVGLLEQEPEAVAGWPWFPDWAPVGYPGEVRDGLTLSWSRRSLFGGRLGSGTWVFLSVRGFRAVNDGWGCSVGDRVLSAVAEALRSVGGDRWVRYAGDEWVGVFEEEWDLDAMGARLREAVLRVDVEGAKVGASVWAARWSGSVEEVLESLYDACGGRVVEGVRALVLEGRSPGG